VGKQIKVARKVRQTLQEQTQLELERMGGKLGIDMVEF